MFALSTENFSRTFLPCSFNYVSCAVACYHINWSLRIYVHTAVLTSSSPYGFCLRFSLGPSARINMSPSLGRPLFPLFASFFFVEDALLIPLDSTNATARSVHHSRNKCSMISTTRLPHVCVLVSLFHNLYFCVVKSSLAYAQGLLAIKSMVASNRNKYSPSMIYRANIIL